MSIQVEEFQKTRINGHSKENPYALKVENLNVWHEQYHILKNVNLNIKSKQITKFLGPSGCGKTTFLKSLNRLTDLYSGMKVTGNIWMGENDILSNKNDITLLRQRMGLLSQRPYILPMSIAENIAFGLKIQGITNKGEIRDKVEYHLKQVALWDEISDRLKDPASRLSIGQQQRLCLARGLAVNPEIILADEPTSALDPVSSRKIEEQFQELKKDYTIILVTHFIRQARKLADHVVFMYYGEIMEQGNIGILENPQTESFRQYVKGA